MHTMSMQTIRNARRPVTALAVGLAIATLPAIVLVAACATVLVAWLALLVHGWRTGRYPATPWARFEPVAAPDAARGDRAKPARYRAAHD